MKLSLCLLLPLTASAFAPTAQLTRTNRLVVRNEIDDACETIVDKTEEVLSKADDLVVSRARRVLDHAPMLLTLNYLANKAGMAISRSSVTANPSAFAGLKTALPVPTWCFNVWAVVALTQLASIAKSALASNGNELSQADITVSSAANVVAASAIGASNPLGMTALTAVVSGYAQRTNGSKVTIHSAGMQLMSSFTSVLTILGVISALSDKLSFVNGDMTSVLGVCAYYVLATRNGNGTIKKAVNAGVITGVVVSRLAAGVSVAANVPAVIAGAITVGSAFVAYNALNDARKAIFD